MSQPEQQPVVFVTGGARGLGAALVERFEAAGFRVIASARRPPTDDSRAWLEWKTLDIGQPGACEKIIGEIFDRWGRLDIVVSNASGYLREATLHDLAEAEIAEELDVTLRGAIYLARAFVHHAREEKCGRIIFVASSAGLDHEPGCGRHAVYSAAKAALIRFAEALHEDISRLGLQSQVVIPANMRESKNVGALINEQALSYCAAAQAIVSLALTDGNLAITRAELRPSQMPSKT